MHDVQQFAEIATQFHFHTLMHTQSLISILPEHHAPSLSQSTTSMPPCFTKWTSILDYFPYLLPPRKHRQINFASCCSRNEFATRSVLKTNHSSYEKVVQFCPLFIKSLLFFPRGSEQEQKGLPNAAHPSTYNKRTSPYSGEGLVAQDGRSTKPLRLKLKVQENRLSFTFSRPPCENMAIFTTPVKSLPYFL